MLSIMPLTAIKSYGATYTYTNNSNNLPADFDAKYPNYRILINTLVQEHPNWTFKLYETGLDWNTVLNYESKHGKNLVQPGYYTSEWGCSCNVAYDGEWKCASRSAIEYMMDPRHFLNSYDVFQFQDLSSASGDSKAIASMIAGTFMDTNAHRCSRRGWRECRSRRRRERPAQTAHRTARPPRRRPCRTGRAS